MPVRCALREVRGAPRPARAERVRAPGEAAAAAELGHERADDDVENDGLSDAAKEKEEDSGIKEEDSERKEEESGRKEEDSGRKEEDKPSVWLIVFVFVAMIVIIILMIVFLDIFYHINGKLLE